MTTIINLAKDIATCVQFLSRLPIPRSMANHDKPDFSIASRAFPIAGFIITLPAVIAILLFSFLQMPVMVIAALTIGIQLLATGALHEDGLADCLDGFGGGHTCDDKLDIMKDSRVGSFGLSATIMALLLRFALLTSLLHISVLTAVIAYLAAQMLSRAYQVYFWQSLPPARLDGLANMFGTPGTSATQWALGIGIVSTLILTFPTFPTLGVGIALAGSVMALFMFRQLCLKHIGGQTGDTIGAVQVITEIAFLIGLTTFSS